MEILVADDDPGSRSVLGILLQNLGHHVTVVENGRRAWDVLRRDNQPLLISDWVMPEMDGLSLCRAIRAESHLPYTYIILLTAMGGADDYLDGIEAGADDFIVKPVDPKYLTARLNVAGRILALHERLRRQATHDHLTGVLNRGAVLEDLYQQLERAGREGHEVGVLMVDLDHFKRINDSYGHPTGDAVLRETTRRMHDSLRPYDRIGRYGGEEFLVVLPGSDPAHVASTAERIRCAVSDSPIACDSHHVAVTVSVGAAATTAGLHDVASLVAAADEALYRAKALGRNRVEVS